MRVAFMLAVPILLLAGQVPASEIWRCSHADGTVEFRDRPCPARSGARGEKYRSGPGNDQPGGTFNSYAPSPPPVYPERPLSGTTRARGETGHDPASARSGERELRCAEYGMRIEAINRRLRKGYSVKEGNELRAERRRIESLLNAACRR